MKKHTELWALFWENVAKIAKKAKGCAELLDDFVVF